MAKVASSKPYGSGKRSSTADPDPVDSPIRTSPRRRKSGAAAEEETKKAGSKKSSAPTPPRFTDTKKPRKGEKVRTPLKIDASKPAKSPKTPRRKSALEPVILNEEPVVEEQEDQEDEVIDYVESINQENNSQVTEEPYDDAEEYTEEYAEDTEDNVYTDTVYNEEQDDDVYTEEELVESEYTEETEEFHYDEDDNRRGYNGQSDSEGLNEEGYNEQFKYTSESVRSRLSQYFNRHESGPMTTPTAPPPVSQLWTRMKDWISERVIPSAREIGVYTKRTIEQISRRLERRPPNTVDVAEYDDSAADIEYDEEYENVYEDLNEHIYADDNERIYADDNEHIYGEEDEHVSGSESGSDTSSPKIYEITEDNGDQEYFSESTNPIIEEDYNMEEDEPVPVIESKESSYHSLMHDVTLIMEPIEPVLTTRTPEKPPQTQTQTQFPQSQISQSTSSMMNLDILDSRLTEIVLFLAKCSKTTPLPSIYEHLEELFTLKGEKSLNFTEKQLVSTVIRDLLTEKASGAGAGDAPVYEAVVMAHGGERGSPKRIKVLPSSGIRFRAPKFTAEEEARLEEMEQARLQKTMSKLTASLATPSQRSKMQKKLLNPESTVEMMETMRENVGRIGATEKKRKGDDGISSAIEDIISQKIKESKRKEECDRLETEKLKQRVTELERETRERSTKEALLQKQLEEQKKELEIEKEASKSKIESLKAAAAAAAVVASKPVMLPASSVPVSAGGFGFMGRKNHQEAGDSGQLPHGSLADEKPPSSPAFNFGSFGGKRAAAEAEPIPKKEAEAGEAAKPNFTPFSNFNFGAAKAGSEEVKKESLNPEAPPFKAPASPFGFSFGSTTPAAKKPEPAEEEEEMGPEAKKPSFGFSGFKPKESEPAFSFGAGSGAAVKPSFKPSAFDSFKASESSQGPFGPPAGGLPAASAFNFESKAPPAPANKAFSFGSADGKRSFGFGEPMSDTTSSSNNGSNTSTNTSTNTSAPSPFIFGPSSISNPPPAASSNPFAALSSNTNIFASTAPTTFNPTSSFSFGTSATNSSNNKNNNDLGLGFGFPPASFGGGAAPIIPMNFGGAAAAPNPNDPQEQQMDMSFQAGRSISIPRRRRK